MDRHITIPLQFKSPYNTLQNVCWSEKGEIHHIYESAFFLSEELACVTT